MFQFYFLSVFFLVLNGFILTLDKLSEKTESLAKVKDVLTSKQSLFIIGTAGAITGVLNLFITSDNFIIIGDFLPALACLAVGLANLMGFYKESSTSQAASLEKIDNLLTQNKSIIGFVAMGIGLVHFLFPTVYFL